MEAYQARTQVLNNGNQNELSAPPHAQVNETELSIPLSPAPDVDCGCSQKSSQQSGQPLQTGAPSYVYAIGRIEPRFPSLSVEREFSQLRALERRSTAGKTERETLYLVLSKHKYVARRMCYVLTVEGLDTYLLHPEDPADYVSLLVEAIRPPETTSDVKFDVVIGTRGAIAQPERCQGLMIPVLSCNQIYSFSKESLLESIPLPVAVGEFSSKADPLAFRRSAEEVFDRIIHMADNAGAMEEHRALNYSAVRYPGLYARVAQEHAENRSLSGVEVRRSPLGNPRSIMDVILSFTDRASDVTEKCFCRIDVTGEFPFLVTKLCPFYER